MSVNDFVVNLFSNAVADSKLGELAAKVALQNFDYRYITILFFNSTLYYGVELFLREFNYNIVINRGKFNTRLTKTTRQYVIFGSDVTDLEQLLEMLIELEVVNTGKFIIVCQSIESNDCDEKGITNTFWEYKIVNVVFIKSEESQAFGYTYYPLSEGKCNNVNPVKLDSCNYSVINAHGEIFRMKLKKFNSCPLIVTTFIQSPYMNITNGIPVGADGDLLRIIAYGLNTSIKLISPNRGDSWGFRLKNGTWMGSLADLYDDLANFSMTSAALTLSRFEDFQSSRGYYSVHIVWITHPATLQNEALKLMHPFEQSTRIALVVSYLLVLICAFIVRTDQWSSMYGTTGENQPAKSLVFYSWMICMGQAVIKLPSKSALLNIIILWIYFGLIIRTAYQVYLISSLKGTFYEDQFESIEDAIAANYPFGGGAALQDYYIDYPAVFNNWINVDAPEIIPTLFDLSKGKKFVLAMNWDTAKILIKKHKINLHVLPQKILTSPTTIFFKKYSPLVESINLILGRLTAAGFPQKLHQNYTSFKLVETNNGEETLKIVHFTACYVILMTGWILSAVFFLLEIYFGKIYKHPMISP